MSGPSHQCPEGNSCRWQHPASNAPQRAAGWCASWGQRVIHMPAVPSLQLPASRSPAPTGGHTLLLPSADAPQHGVALQRAGTHMLRG